jgi:hypothetical protein
LLALDVTIAGEVVADTMGSVRTPPACCAGSPGVAESTAVAYP